MSSISNVHRIEDRGKDIQEDKLALMVNPIAAQHLSYWTVQIIDLVYNTKGKHTWLLHSTRRMAP